MMARPLRWGLLSTARINAALIAALGRSPRSQLWAVSSRDGARAEAYAAGWGIPRAYISYEAMLADPEIDVVYISLPNNLHAQWTIQAAQAGKHVLCEKPLALSVEEVAAIADAAQRKGVVVAEALMYRHFPQTLRVRELLDAGAIGKLLLVRGAYSHDFLRPGDYRFDPALGGGSIWDVGIYPISFCRMAFGAEPEEVFGWRVLGPTGVDLAFAGQLRFPGNRLAQFDCSFGAPHRMPMELVGDAGTIELTQAFWPDPAGRIAMRRGDRVEVETISQPEHFLGEVEDMADAVLLGQPLRVSLADSRGNVAAIRALLRSALEGKPVAIGV